MKEPKKRIENMNRDQRKYVTHDWKLVSEHKFKQLYPWIQAVNARRENKNNG